MPGVPDGGHRDVAVVEGIAHQIVRNIDEGLHTASLVQVDILAGLLCHDQRIGKQMTVPQRPRANDDRGQ
jgi:hypothetical protein